MLGIVSAASDVRDARCVRSGPTSLVASVPRIAWQAPQCSAKRPVSGPFAGFDSRASQARNFAGGSATANTDLATQYKDDFSKAPPKVQELLTQLQTYHAQAGTADAAKLYTAVSKANVHVDSRYGYWDAAQASVVPFGAST